MAMSTAGHTRGPQRRGMKNATRAVTARTNTVVGRSLSTHTKSMRPSVSGPVGSRSPKGLMEPECEASLRDCTCRTKSAPPSSPPSLSGVLEAGW